MPVFALKEIVVVPTPSAASTSPGSVILPDGSTGQLIAVLNASPITEIGLRRFRGGDSSCSSRRADGCRSRLRCRAAPRRRDADRARRSDHSHLGGIRRTPGAALETTARGRLDRGSSKEPMSSTATSASEPIVGWLAPGTHINAAGAFRTRPGEPPAKARPRASSSTGASRRSTRRATTASPRPRAGSGPSTSSESSASCSTARSRAGGRPTS